MQLATQVTRRWRKVKLTEKQSADVLGLCKAAVKANPALDLSDRKAVSPVVKTITETARANILTDEQRAQLPKPKPRKPRKPRKPKPDA